MEFEAYYKSLGLKSYPFSKFTAEAEMDKAEEIYKKPSNYSVINELISGSSIIISGERGSGKTALNLDIGRRKDTKDTLLVRLEDFSKLAENYSHDDVYKFITEVIAGHFFIKMSFSPNVLWKYDNDERIDLSMYLSEYVPTSTKNQLKEHIKIIQNGFLKRTGIKLYNLFRIILNYGMKAATKAVSDAITKHFSALPEFDSGDAEYFIKLETEIDETFTLEDRSFHYLDKLCKLILKSNIKQIVILIDKIDEDPRFKNDAERIAKYIEGIASNNKIMINDSFNVVLFTWSTPFNSIKSNIRTQKISFQPLSWTSKGLREAAGKRLSAFSNNETKKLESIFEENSYDAINELVLMCNENPRDFWHLLDKSIVSQFELDSGSKITAKAVHLGIEKFVKQFNYYEYYPRKANARADSMDIYSYIKHLMKLDSNEFTKNKLKDAAKTGGSTNNYVVSMENMGLIKKTGGKTSQGGVIYEIRDPKVRYAREKEIAISRA
ncbi:P-loop ATPase, Sll1717 family [Microbulbifer epialgicus]|uniref:P-loop ATPase, Sll1717 family n=1 Tax=Microbulbifer epialgicus TaxID=393907 RepID=A0ABV4P7Q0_9GAMM